MTSAPPPVMDLDGDAPPDLVDLGGAEVTEEVQEITDRVPITIVTGSIPNAPILTKLCF